MFYTARDRKNCLDVYAGIGIEFPECPGKLFKCMLGIDGAMVKGNAKWNSGRKHKQYLYRPGTYSICMLEVHCMEGHRDVLPETTSTHEHVRAARSMHLYRQNRQRETIAQYISEAFDPRAPASEQRRPGPQAPLREPRPSPKRLPENDHVNKRLTRWQDFVSRKHKAKKARAQRRRTHQRLPLPTGLAVGEDHHGRGQRFLSLTSVCTASYACAGVCACHVHCLVHHCSAAVHACMVIMVYDKVANGVNSS